MLAPMLLPANLRAVAEPAKTAPFSRFVDVSESAGLTQTMFYGDSTHNTYIVEVNGAGCAFFDYDNDGWMDAFILGGRRLEGIPPGASNRLYHNNRDGTFTDVTAKAGLTDAGWASGVCVGDYNNDGFEDLYHHLLRPEQALSQQRRRNIHRRDGQGRTARLVALRFGSGCTFVDYNRDGCSIFSSPTTLTSIWRRLPSHRCKCPIVISKAYPRIAVRADFPRPITRSTATMETEPLPTFPKNPALPALRGSYGFTAVAFDADEDGWQDISCSLRRHAQPAADEQSRRHVSRRGIAAWHCSRALKASLWPAWESASATSISTATSIWSRHTSSTSPPASTTTMARESSKMSPSAPDSAANAALRSWGTGLVDLDNDGYPDIFIVAGTVAPELEKVYAKYPARNPRLIFRNQGNGTFVELGDEAGPAIASRHVSRGCAFGDFDNDGDLDILIMNRNEPPTLLRNDVPGRQSLDQSPPRGNEKQSQRNRCSRISTLRGKGAGSMPDQPVKFSIVE